MSLFDIDKSSDNRDQPMLNASDALNVGSVKAHATEGISYRTEVIEGKPRVIVKDDQILVYDGTNNRVLLGRDTGGF